MPESLGSAWEMIGGGPPDLFYPDEFLGTWQVVSTLVAVDVPMGEEMLNDARVSPLVFIRRLQSVRVCFVQRNSTCRTTLRASMHEF